MNRLNALSSRLTTSYQKAVDYYEGLGQRAKILLWIWVALHIIGGAVFWWIGWQAIFACSFHLLLSPPHPKITLRPLSYHNVGLAQLADNIRELSYGWAILSLIVIVRLPFSSLFRKNFLSLNSSLLNHGIRSPRYLLWSVTVPHKLWSDSHMECIQDSLFQRHLV